MPTASNLRPPVARPRGRRGSVDDRDTDGDDLVVIASKGGAPANPDWYYNIKANPVVTVEWGHEQFPAQAVIAEGAERDRLFNQMAAAMPAFAEYQRNTDRKIPVVILKRMR